MTAPAKLLVVLAVVGLAGACSSDDSGGSSPGKGGSGGTSSGGTSSGGTSAGGTGGSGGSTGGAGGSTGGAAGSGGSTGGAAGSDAGGAAGNPGDGGPPQTLSETGLYADIASGTLASGVVEYQPQFVLWSDAATKKRWVYLPPGTKIDTSDMDYWIYPVGMKLWKEFTRNGTRVETRMLWKQSATEWFMMAYQWNSAQTEATAVPAGVKNASGTPHDIPSSDDCKTCHAKTKDRAASFSAIQLSHNLGGLNLTDLISQGRLTNPPSGNFVLPGNATDKAALGYMHANCGICHNENSFEFALVKMQLWLKTAELATVQGTSTYTTTVNQALTASNPTPQQFRIVPKDPSKSDVHFRMNERGTLTQMPPLGTEDVDSAGLKAVDDWINSL